MRIIAFAPDYNAKHKRILEAFAGSIPGAEVLPLGEYVPCDIAIIFGGYKYAYDKTKPKREILEKHTGRRLIMIEAAFVKRGEYHQIGWGGFAGNADFNADGVDSERWNKIGVKVRPWTKSKHGHIVVMGQLGRDVQVQDTDHYAWVRGTVSALESAGQRVLFKPHPKEKDVSVYGVRKGNIHKGSMADALAGAKSVVTWNSTSAVDAIISGIPAVAMCSSSIAKDIAGNTLRSAINPSYPSRRQFFNMLGYAQWTMQEIENGDPWRHLNK
jgi:hypothetical protein